MSVTRGHCTLFLATPGRALWRISRCRREAVGPTTRDHREGSLTPALRFSPAVAAALDAAKILGVRAGDEHRHTGVWVVVVEGRVFVRSWNDKPTGWYRAFRTSPEGSISLGKREIPVRASPVRSERLRAAVSAAYGEKYDAKASEKWVSGFAEPEREANTLELTPTGVPTATRPGAG